MTNTITTYSNLYKVNKILSQSSIIKELEIQNGDHLYITIMTGIKSYSKLEHKYILNNVRTGKHRIIKHSWWHSYVQFPDSPKELYPKPVIELEHTDLPHSYFNNTDMLTNQQIF